MPTRSSHQDRFQSGLDVLTAVINAPATDYIYYVSDKSGHNHYAKNAPRTQCQYTKYGLQLKYE